jgi:pimeloyl-ACP methyl ester carboxylesterase
MESRYCFVLLHGSWLGGWCWRSVTDLLEAEGHLVMAPSLLGFSERADALSGDLTLDSLIDDVVDHIIRSSLPRVVLVGHSFAGVVITGVADRIPALIQGLIYLDAMIVRNGKSAFSGYSSAEVEHRLAKARSSETPFRVPVPTTIPAEWGIEGELARLVLGSLTPHPLGPYLSPLRLTGPLGGGKPLSYIRCTRPRHPLLNDVFYQVRYDGVWRTVDLPTAHLPMLTDAKALAKLLVELANN